MSSLTLPRTPRRRDARAIRTRAALVAVFALVVSAVTLTASPAAAHDNLISSNPAADAALETAPTEVELVFSDEVLTMGATVLVVDESGTDWVAGDLTIDTSTVTVPLAADMPDAGYQIRWQVVSSDGHPISAVVPFTVGDAEPYTAPAVPDAQTPGAAPDAGNTDAGATGPGPWLLIVVAIAGAVVAVALYLVVVLLRRKQSDSPDAPSA